MSTRSRRLVILGTLAAALVVAVGAQVLADTIDVPGDYNTLREALQEADSGDVIEISRTSLRESLSVRNVRNVTVRSEREGRSVTITGRYDSKPVIELINCRDVVFQDIAVQSGSVGVQLTGSQEVTFLRCAMQKNFGTGVVGTDTSTSGATLFTLDECTIEQNLGWGVERVGDPNRIQDSKIEILNTTIRDNALGGFRIHAAVATAASSTFARNDGYGIFVDGQAEVTFNDSGAATRSPTTRSAASSSKTLR